MKKKETRGRKKLPADMALKGRVQVICTRDEQTQFEKAAREKGFASPSQRMRSLALAAASKESNSQQTKSNGTI
jgi:hypothetical protein